MAKPRRVEIIFSERLRGEMNRQGISVSKLSKMSGIGKSLISAYLMADCAPTIINLRKIANALKVSSDFLIGI